MTESGLVRRLDDQVRAAKEGVTLYRLMYAGVEGVDSLESFLDLPILTPTMLATERLIDTITDPGQVCVTRTFGDESDQRGYMPRLLSYEDVLREYDVLAFVMEFAGLRGRHRVMLIGDEHHAYTITEFGKYLAFYGWPLATFIMTGQPSDELKAHLRWFKPTLVFVDSEREPPAEMLPRSTRLLFTFNKPGWGGVSTRGTRTYAWLDLFRDPWVGLAAVKSEAECNYTFNPLHHYFENDGDGALLVTSFVNRLQPVIRYRVSRLGSVSGGDKFCLRPDSV